MKGEWLLVRMKGKPREKNENWLLRKVEDDHAGPADSLTGRALTSVKTGRTMQEIAENAIPRNQSQAAARGNKAVKMPAFQTPQLPTLVDHVPPRNQLLHDLHYDG